jgi:hypothetical protein
MSQKQKSFSKKIFAVCLCVAIVFSTFLTCSFNLTSNSGPLVANAQTQQMNIVLTASLPQPIVLNVSENVTFQAYLSIPTHNETYCGFPDFWNTYINVVPDYLAENISYSWQIQGASDAWNLTQNAQNATLTSVAITDQPVYVNVTALYNGITVLGASSVKIESASQPKNLHVKLDTPKGQTPKLSVNEVLPIAVQASFQNQYENASFPVFDASYTWTITPHEDMVLNINGAQDSYVANCSREIVDGPESLNFSFSSATTAEVWIHVDVSCAGQTVGYSLVVTDPASYPSYYLGASTSQASAIINKDESGGWYYAVNGITGLTTESTNCSDLVSNVIRSGGLVSFGSGTFDLDSSIIITNAVTLTGKDAYTLLNISYNVDAPLIRAENATDISISHISLNHNLNDTDKCSARNLKHGITARNITGLTIEYVSCTNTMRSFQIGSLDNYNNGAPYGDTHIDCSNVLIQYCDFTNVGSGVFAINGQHIKILYNTVINSTNDGIGLRGSIKANTIHTLDDAIVQGNTLESVGETCIRIEVEFGNVTENCMKNIIVTENTINNTGWRTGGSAISFHASSANTNYSTITAGETWCSNVTVTKNIITHCVNQAFQINQDIYAYAVENVIFAENIVAQSGAPDALRIRNAHGVTVDGNRISSTEYGISIDGYSSDVMVLNNAINSLYSGVYATYSSGVVINDNNITAGGYAVWIAHGANVVNMDGNALKSISTSAVKIDTGAFNVSISDCVVNGVFTIDLNNCSDIEVANCQIYATQWGVGANGGCSDIRILNNKITAGYGPVVVRGQNFLVSGNTLVCHLTNTIYPAIDVYVDAMVGTSGFITGNLFTEGYNAIGFRTNVQNISVTNNYFDRVNQCFVLYNTGIADNILAYNSLFYCPAAYYDPNGCIGSNTYTGNLEIS